MRARLSKDTRKRAPQRVGERVSQLALALLFICLSLPGPVLCKLGQPGVLFLLPEVLTPVLGPSFVTFSRAFPFLVCSHRHFGLLFPVLPTERFCEDLRELLELIPQNDVLFIIGDWNAKVGSQETPGVTGKFGLGMRNEAGKRLIEICQENELVIANTLFQQHKRRLYTLHITRWSTMKSD